MSLGLFRNQAQYLKVARALGVEDIVLGGGIDQRIGQRNSEPKMVLALALLDMHNDRGFLSFSDFAIRATRDDIGAIASLILSARHGYDEIDRWISAMGGV